MSEAMLALTLVAGLYSAPPIYRDPLLDRERFPPRELAHAGMMFNRAFRNHLRDRAAFEPHKAEWYMDAMIETDRLFHCWDWLHAAQGGEGRDEVYWRQSMRELRNWIGDEAYYAGSMPPSVPMWAFSYAR